MKHVEKHGGGLPGHEGIRIVSHCTGAFVSALEFNERFGEYAKYRSIYTRRRTLEELADSEGANVVLAVDPKLQIVGFCVLDFPAEGERWRDVGDGRVMMEVKALEVSRQNRSMGIAPALLEGLLADTGLESKILYLVGYSWTWDLEGARMTVWRYRKKLIDLYGRFGFKEYQTNDFNICLKPENIFMGRIGNQVSPEIRTAFKWICFGQTP